jgi:hypothetical protein
MKLIWLINSWGTAVECQSCTPTISTQTYVDTTIILKSADLTFPQTLGASSGATHSEMTTSDGGKTWYIALMTIPAMNPSGNTVSSFASYVRVLYSLLQ